MFSLKLTKKHFGVALLAVFLSLINLPVDPHMFSHQETGVYSQSKEDLFKYVTDIQDIPEWFPVFQGIYQTDEKPMRVGKTYKGVVKLLMGYTYTMDLKISEMIRGTKVVVTSEDLFKPVITVHASRNKQGKGQLAFHCYYNRTSAMFQYTTGPMLKFLTMQNMRHSLFVLKWLLPESPNNSGIQF